MRKKLLLLGGMILCLLTVQAQNNKRTLRPGDVYQLQSASGAVISPDGKWILYSHSFVDSAKDKRNTDLWMMSWDAKEKIQLTNGPDSEGNAKWSPDNKYISFTASRSGSNQIFLLNRMGGEGIKLTDVKGELNDYAWHPNGKQLVLVIKDQQDSAQKGAKPYVIDRYRFKQDVTGYIYDKRKTHLYLFDIDTKKIDTLTKGDYNESSPVYSPDGSYIAFSSNHTADPDKNSNTDIFIIESKKGATAKQLTTWNGSDGSPQWSPDGKQIAYLRSNSDENYIMYGQSVLCVIDAAGGQPKLLSAKLDRPVSNIRWYNNGTAIACLVSDDCKRYLASYNVANGIYKILTNAEESIGSVELHPNGEWLASISNPQLPAELFVIATDFSRRQLTNYNQTFLSGIQLASVEKFVSKSKDGTLVSNLLFVPAGKEKKNLPVIFFIHGGPVAQDEFSFDLSRQMLAAQGYAVVAVNYRGSSGRGLDFCKSIYADWGNKEVLDILGASDYLAAKGIIDATKQGIGGWSYGGILTNYSIATDTRFKAASSGAGSALQLSLYGVDQYILQLDNELGQPWKDKNYEKYLKISYPFLQADKIKTPTQYMVGEKDFNVPAVGSEQMYQALKSIGIPTELIIYPGQFHGITVPSFQKDRFERYINWFNQYLK